MMLPKRTRRDREARLRGQGWQHTVHGKIGIVLQSRLDQESGLGLAEKVNLTHVGPESV